MILNEDGAFEFEPNRSNNTTSAKLKSRSGGSISLTKPIRN